MDNQLHLGFFGSGIRAESDLDKLIAATPNPVLLFDGLRVIPENPPQFIWECAEYFAERYPKAIFRTNWDSDADKLFIAAVGGVDQRRIQLVLECSLMRKKYLRVETANFTGAVMHNPPAQRITEAQTLEDADSREIGDLFKYFARFDANKDEGTSSPMDSLLVAGSPELGLAPATVAFVFIDPDNPLSGGPEHTIRLCAKFGVPVFPQNEWTPWLCDVI